MCTEMGIAGSVGAAYFACHPGRRTMWHVEASELGKVAARDHVHLVGETGLHKSINHLWVCWFIQRSIGSF